MQDSRLLCSQVVQYEQQSWKFSLALYHLCTDIYQHCLTTRSNKTPMSNNVSKLPGPSVDLFSTETVFLKMPFVACGIES